LIDTGAQRDLSDKKTLDLPEGRSSVFFDLSHLDKRFEPCASMFDAKPTMFDAKPTRCDELLYEGAFRGGAGAGVAAVVGFGPGGSFSKRAFVISYARRVFASVWS
jgi:hypothetical protein